MKKINIPDFDDMQKAISEIQDLSVSRLSLEIDIKSKEAEIIFKVLGDSKYFVNSKIPSMTFIDSTYKYTGLDGELLPLRKELARLVALLEYAKNSFYLMKSAIDVWRSQTANERATLL